MKIMSVHRSFYQVLDVDTLATQEEIEAAYAARLKDDESGAAILTPSERSLLQSGYDILRNPARRERYDEQMIERLRKASTSSGAPARESATVPSSAVDPAGRLKSEWLTFPRLALLSVTLLLGIWMYLFFTAKVEETRLEHARRVEELRAKKQQEAKLKEEQKNATENIRLEDLRNLIQQVQDSQEQGAGVGGPQQLEWQRRQLQQERVRKQQEASRVAEQDRAQQDRQWAEQERLRQQSEHQAARERAQMMENERMRQQAEQQFAADRQRSVDDAQAAARAQECRDAQRSLEVSSSSNKKNWAEIDAKRHGAWLACR